MDGIDVLQLVVVSCEMKRERERGGRGWESKEEKGVKLSLLDPRKKRLMSERFDGM
jgi:hypothetical protein